MEVSFCNLAAWFFSKISFLNHKIYPFSSIPKSEEDEEYRIEGDAFCSNQTLYGNY